MQLMSLGMFIFEVGGFAYSELQRKSDWQHATSPRVGARDATQFTGVGTETINLTGTAYAELTNGRASIDDLRTMADAGEALPLVDGAGTVFGDYVITAIDERHANSLPNGTPRRIDFAIDLLRVDDVSDVPDATSETASNGASQ